MIVPLLTLAFIGAPVAEEQLLNPPSVELSRPMGHGVAYLLDPLTVTGRRVTKGRLPAPLVTEIDERLTGLPLRQPAPAPSDRQWVGIDAFVGS